MSEDKDDLAGQAPAEMTGEENVSHSDYRPDTETGDSITHHLGGMYQTWFLDYASYVILERAVPHINDGLKPVPRTAIKYLRSYCSVKKFPVGYTALSFFFS